MLGRTSRRGNTATMTNEKNSWNSHTLQSPPLQRQQGKGVEGGHHVVSGGSEALALHFHDPAMTPPHRQPSEDRPESSSSLYRSPAARSVDVAGGPGLPPPSPHMGRRGTATPSNSSSRAASSSPGKHHHPSRPAQASFCPSPVVFSSSSSAASSGGDDEAATRIERSALPQQERAAHAASVTPRPKAGKNTSESTNNKGDEEAEGRRVWIAERFSTLESLRLSFELQKVPVGGNASSSSPRGKRRSPQRASDEPEKERQGRRSASATPCTTRGDVLPRPSPSERKAPAMIGGQIPPSPPSAAGSGPVGEVEEAEDLIICEVHEETTGEGEREEQCIDIAIDVDAAVHEVEDEGRHVQWAETLKALFPFPDSLTAANAGASVARTPPRPATATTTAAAASVSVVVTPPHPLISLSQTSAAEHSVSSLTPYGSRSRSRSSNKDEDAFTTTATTAGGGGTGRPRRNDAEWWDHSSSSSTRGAQQGKRRSVSAVSLQSSSRHSTTSPGDGRRGDTGRGKGEPVSAGVDAYYQIYKAAAAAQQHADHNEIEREYTNMRNDEEYHSNAFQFQPSLGSASQPSSQYRTTDGTLHPAAPFSFHEALGASNPIRAEGDGAAFPITAYALTNDGGLGTTTLGPDGMLSNDMASELLRRLRDLHS